MRTPRPDLTLHFAGGVLTTLAGLPFGWPWALAACAAAAVLRETYNRHNGGPFDWADIAATMAGSVPVLLAAGLGL